MLGLMGQLFTRQVVWKREEETPGRLTSGPRHFQTKEARAGAEDTHGAQGQELTPKTKGNVGAP